MPTLRPTRRQRRKFKGIAGLFPPEGITEPFKPLDIIWTQRFPFGTGGENRAIPADVLQPDEAYLIKNFKINQGDIEPAYGYSEVGTPKAVPTEILEINTYKEVAGASALVRIDEDALQSWDGSSWTVVTGGMTGDQDDKIRSAMILDSFIFVNGVDAPQAWTNGATYADLTADVNAPSTARFLAGYADRAVFADIGTGASRNTQRLEWSVSGDPTDFTDIGAGGVTLFDAQSTVPADDIMGLETFSNFLVVFRRHSIWIGLRTGNVLSPIEFSSQKQGYGCAASDSIQVVGSVGCIFLSHDNVYLYSPQLREPVPIGTPIRDRLFEVLDRDKMAKVRSAFVPDDQEYWLFVPDSDDAWATSAFVLDVERFRTEDRFVWREQTFFNDPVTAAYGGQTSGLGAEFSEADKVLLIGSDGGETFTYNPTSTTQDGFTVDAEFQSPVFTAGQNEIEFSKLNIAYKGDSTPSINVAFSEDGGENWTTNEVYNLSNKGNVEEVSLSVPAGINSATVMFRIQLGLAQDINLVGYRLGFLQRGPIIGI